MPEAARLGDLIGHAPPIPPVVAAAVAGGAVASGAAGTVGGGLTSAAHAGAEAASGGSGGGGSGVGGVVTGKIIGPCSGNVFINGIPAARALVDQAICSLHPPVPLPIVSGSSNVFINGLPAARLGDSIFCGAIILSGSGNVFIGGSAGGESVQTGPVMSESLSSPLVRESVFLADAITASNSTSLVCYSAETERRLHEKKNGPQAVAWDGVNREDPATAYLRNSGAFNPNANTIEAKVGPTVQPFVLAAIPGGNIVLMAQGGYQMGEGIAQVGDGKNVQGALNIAGGGLMAAGGVIAPVASGRGGASIPVVYGTATEVSSAGVRFGKRTPIPIDSDRATTRSLKLENESADILAANGYRVQQNPKVDGPKNPDYKINGTIYDNYAPETANARNIWKVASDKVASGQAPNVVINLKDSNVQLPVLKQQFLDHPIEGLGRAIVIDKLGRTHVIKESN